MLRTILLAALVAGSAAGLTSAALQQLRTVPLIHAAEIYEEQDLAAHQPHDMAAMGHDPSAAAGADEGWQPEEGLQRIGLTIVADLLQGAGFGLLLTAALSLYAALGGAVDGRRGLLWGLAGFAIFHLAPAFGLPPEPPGAPVAELAARQQWWLMTAACTAIGLGLLVFGRRWPLQLAGIASLLLPHLLGAPHPLALETSLPAPLAAEFAAASIATASVFWLVLGGVGGWMYRRLTA